MLTLAPAHLMSHLEAAHHFGLPTFDVGKLTLLSRLTLVIEEGVVKKVFFPVDDAAQNAALVSQYLMMGEPS